MDYSLYRTVNGLSGNPFANGLMTSLANDLTGILVAAVALTFLVKSGLRRQQRRGGAMLAPLRASTWEHTIPATSRPGR